VATQEIVFPAGRAAAFKTVLLGGLVAGVLDGMDAIVFLARGRGVAVRRVFQFIVSGLLGVKAFAGGLGTAWLGCGLHFLIATSVAAACYVLSLKVPALLRKPVIFGPIYGLVVFAVMHYLVVPMSAAPKQPPLGVASFLNLVFSHVVFVGLPIALITRRLARLEE
jgi:hypothetical protein